MKERHASAGASATNSGVERAIRGRSRAHGPKEGGEGCWPPSSLTWNQVSPFQVIPNFLARSSALFWRPSLFPCSGRDWAAAEPRAWQEQSTQERGARIRVGVRNPAHNEGPLDRSSKFLKSQLLEYEATTTSSLGAKCVCHYSRPPAPPSPPGWGAQPELTAGLAPALSHTSLIPQTAGELSKPWPQSAPPVLVL